MARQEQDREDLLREATALVERAAFRLPDGREVVVGFRGNGCGGVYFGGEPVYQFNSRGELRRAFAGGRLFKADAGRLAAMQRVRTAEDVQLVRTDLDDAAAAEFLADCRRDLTALLNELDAGRAQLAGQVPIDGDVPRRVGAWLAELLADDLRVATAPNAR